MQHWTTWCQYWKDTAHQTEVVRIEKVKPMEEVTEIKFKLTAECKTHKSKIKAECELRIIEVGNTMKQMNSKLIAEHKKHIEQVGIMKGAINQKNSKLIAERNTSITMRVSSQNSQLNSSRNSQRKERNTSKK
jgi:hypothetical protein